MAYATTGDGVRLYYESSGAGTPIVFVHEFAASCRSFDAQVKALQPRQRCIAFNARGYPPSDVPPALEAYSQARAAQDIVDLLDALGEAKAHLVGVSMGAAAALQVALTHPERTLSALLCSIGTGSDAPPDKFQSSIEAMALLIDQQGMTGLASHMGNSPSRRKLKDKDAAAFERFTQQLLDLSALGAANTMRGVQKRRLPVYACEKALATLSLPILVVHGADDAECRKPCEFIARAAVHGRLERVENAGHAVNLEAPEAFNRLCSAFIDQVERRAEKP